MNRRIQISITFGFALLLCFSFIWVPSNANSTSLSSTSIKFWYFDNGIAETHLLDLIDQFESENVGIAVNATYIPYESILGTFEYHFFEDDYPDLVQLHGDWVSKLVIKNMLQPVEDVFENVEDIMPAASRGLTFYDPDTSDVHVYAFPYAVDTIIGYANSEIFNNASLDLPPTDTIWSWSEWLEAATFTNDQRDSVNMTYGFSFTDSPGSFDAFLYGMGSQLFNDLKVDKLHIGITSDAGIAALQLAGDVVNNRTLTPTLAEMGTENTRTLFINQQVAMIFDHYSGLTQFLTSDAFGVDAANLALFQVPQVSNGTSGAPLIVEGFGVNSRTTGENLTSAQSLANFLTRASNLESMAIDHAKLPARVSVYENTTIANDPFISAFTGAIGRAYQYPLSTQWDNSKNIYANR
ncbi:MAG: sugar ABC transporter substrate-binding protein, partial [Candidatus Hodarchaeales archaeon]